MNSSESPVSFRLLNTIAIEDIFSCFKEAFSDYFVAMNFAQEFFERLNIQRGIDYGLSMGVFSGSRMVGLVLNGIGTWQGKKTAYDMGTGVIPDFRRRGLTRKLIQELMPALKAKGIEQYLLEVICENEGAYRLYAEQGFVITRELMCRRAAVSDLRFHKELSLENLTITWSPQLPLREELEAFSDWTPSWQNSFDSLQRSPVPPVVLRASLEGQNVGYLVMHAKTASVAHLAVGKAWRRRGVATALLREFFAKAPYAVENFAWINIDGSHPETLYFIESIGAQASHDQYEMLLSIS